MGIKELKQELNNQEKEILIKHILELYKKYDSVKEYLEFYITPNEEVLLAKYKDKVREGFYPKRGMRLQLSLSRKAINDFNKLNSSPEAIGDLLLYFVECGIEFTNEFGDISESFYTSIENAFDKVLKLFKKENILAKNKKRISDLIENNDYDGYGFSDTLGEIYSSYYD